MPWHWPSTFVLGCWSKLTDGLHAAASSVYFLHFLFGLFTGVGTLLTHCLIFTYFLGTGRWVKEVTLAYDLPDAPLHKRTRELKRATFPPALAAMLVTIATAAGGAGAQLRPWPWQVHLTLGIVALSSISGRFGWNTAMCSPMPRRWTKCCARWTGCGPSRVCRRTSKRCGRRYNRCWHG